MSPTPTPTPIRTVLRAAAVVGAALVAVAVPSMAFAEQADVPLDFAADTGDECLMGSTEGEVAWRAAADVAGTVTDGSPFCDFIRDDEMYAVAWFSAYVGDELVDEAAARADNATEPVELTLTPATIDRVDVQVCRYPLGTDPTTEPGVCGEPQTYRP
jgi:hypothetical protein